MQHRALHATHAARHASLTFSLPCLWSACHHLVDLKPADERAVGGPRIRLELEDEVGAGTHGGRKVIHKGEGVGDECTIAGHHVVGLDLRDGHTIHKRGENTLASLHACREERWDTGGGGDASECKEGMVLCISVYAVHAHQQQQAGTRSAHVAAHDLMHGPHGTITSALITRRCSLPSCILGQCNTTTTTSSKLAPSEVNDPTGHVAAHTLMHSQMVTITSVLITNDSTVSPHIPVSLCKCQITTSSRLTCAVATMHCTLTCTVQMV